jgi:hypothetical protein
MAKRKTKAHWEDQTTTAYRITRVIADVLDHDAHLDVATLELVADAMAGAFEFTDEERAEFVQLALVNQNDAA